MLEGVTIVLLVDPTWLPLVLANLLNGEAESAPAAVSRLAGRPLHLHAAVIGPACCCRPRTVAP